MKVFPIDKLRPDGAGAMQARIEFNPYADWPPSLTYGLHIDIENLPNLGELSFFLDGITLSERNWRHFGGPYIAPEKWDKNGSVYVDSAHNPVDTYSVEFLNRRGKSFDVRTDILIDFDFEGVDYENVRFMLNAPVDFYGIVFHEPNWTNPSSVKFPEDWRIPSEYNEETVGELVSRFADLDGYELNRDGTHWKYLPKV